MIQVVDFHKQYRETVAVAGIIPPTRGRLLVAGHDVSADPVAAWAFQRFDVSVETPGE